MTAEREGARALTCGFGNPCDSGYQGEADSALERMRARVRGQLHQLLLDLLELGATPWDLTRAFEDRGWVGLAEMRNELGELYELLERKDRALRRLMAAPGEGEWE